MLNSVLWVTSLSWIWVETTVSIVVFKECRNVKLGPLKHFHCSQLSLSNVLKVETALTRPVFIPPQTPQCCCSDFML